MAPKVILSLLISFSAQAFEIKTAVLEMTLPAPWECKSESDIWICDEDNGIRQKSAIILVQSRKALPKETYNYFRQQLKTPRSVTGKSGNPILSKVESIKDRNLNGHEWFEALHFEGELEGFYTAYIATRRGEQAYLVTMSAHKDKWMSYKAIFEQITLTLKALAPLTPQTLNIGQLNVPQEISAAKDKNTKINFFNKPLDLPIEGLTPLRIIVFAALSVFILAVLSLLKR